MLSAVIITFNEERNIERCIKSLYGVADEILIVDSFSTDNTITICSNLKTTIESPEINFVQKKWEGYAKQKNFANSIAKHDWILSLDADEQLSTTLRQSILEVKHPPPAFHLKSNGVAPVPRLYSMNRCTNYCGKWIRHCGWYPDTKIRLFNRKTAQWSVILIHEELTFDTPATIIHLKGDILHYSYYSVKDHLNQANIFTDLTAQLAFDKNIKSSAMRILLSPIWKFFQSFILKRGFLDGYHGYLVCKISAFATFLKYTKLRQLYDKSKN